MRKINSLFLTVCVLVGAEKLSAQEVTQSQITVDPVKIVNFKEHADFEAIHPVRKRKRFIEQGEDRDREFQFIGKTVPPDAIHFNVNPPQHQTRAVTNSPAPTVSFNGTLDNGSLIPPDIRGAAGINHIMETTNQEFKIYQKSGTLVSTLSITSFFSATGGSGYFDPHILFDAANSRWLVCITGTHSSGHGGIFVGVSQTSDPTGLWYVYSFDGIGNANDFLDFPLMGYNTNWVVVTGNDFLSAGGTTGKIYVMNRATLYSGTLGTVSTFTDANVFALAPAQTLDVLQATEYLVEDWNGNSGGNGYVRIGRITGTAASPTYTAGTTLGVNQPWSENSVTAPQLGSTNKIESGDTRIGNAVYRNGSLWFCQNAFLPAASPTRDAVQWWQVNPVTPAVQQFGRVDGGSATGTFYFYPGIAVNAAGDVLLGHCQSSATTYASASYSIRAASDAVNTLQTPYMYKAGVASYYKTYGGTRNRWGDYTGAAADPSNNSFWNFNEWANAANKWGTVIANVSVAAAIPCNTVNGMSTTSITTNSATFNWAAATGATSYNIQYRIVGSGTWTSATSTTTSYNAASLTANSNYEWQVQTVCTSGSSAFTSSTTFTTLTPACNAPTGLTTTAITTSAATFNWVAASGATSYNIQYRIVGSGTWSTGTAATTSYNASSLTANSNYEWQVQTVCASGSSAFTSSTAFTTLTPACNAPTGLTTTAITTTTATFNWAAASGATSYNIQYRIVGSGTWSTGAAATTSYNAVSLTPNSNYEWQVQTVCASGSSAFTSSTTFTTLTPTCNAPTGLTTTAITTSTATFNWAAASGATSYNIQYRIVGSGTWSTGTAATTSYNAASLTPNSNYEWQVQTVCSSGSSAFTSSATFTTLAPPCNAPTGLTTTAITTTTATFNWTAASGATSYTIQYRIVGSGTWSTATSATTSYNAASLTPNSNYEWQVQTVCASGSSAFTSSATFATLAPSCGVPSGLTSSGITGTDAALSWTAVSGATSYNLQWKLSAGSTWTDVASLATNSYSLTGLVACSAYQFQVQANCSGTLSAYSTLASFTTTGCPLTYCVSKGTNTTYEFINKVEIGTISNTSGNNSGYGNYTALSTNLTGGAVATIILTPGFRGTAVYNEFWTIYIDYNRNGSFADAGEKVTTGSGTAAITRTFIVPATALNGATRMRVQMQYAAYTTNSCTTFTYGEVEDYTVNITGNAQRPVLNETVIVDPDINETLNSFSLYPNPANDKITIEFMSRVEGSVKLHVFNLAGQKIITNDVTVHEGFNKQNVNTNSLTTGVYILEMENDGEIQRQRFDIAK